MAQAPWNAPVPLSYKHITGAGTVVANVGPGILDGLIINSNVGTVTTIAIYDAATGASAASGNQLVATGTVAAGVTAITPVGYTYGLYFNNGLVVVTAGTPDLTVTFR